MFEFGMAIGALFIFICAILDRKELIDDYEFELSEVRAKAEKYESLYELSK